MGTRIYIGNLPATTDVGTLKARFSLYGTIIDIVPAATGFVFLQYLTEEQARKAAQYEHGSIFLGSQIMVTMATNQPQNANTGANQNQRLQGGLNDGNIPNGNDYNRSNTNGEGNFRRPDLSNRIPLPSQGVPQSQEPRDLYGPENPNQSHSDGQGGGPPSQHGIKEEKQNDVEIICLMKSSRRYAERVEVRLKDMGLSVDMLFPNPEIPIGKVLGCIALRGVLFGVCIAPENDTNRSLTVNVLQGDHQEHRNMPLDDALDFIGKNFSKFVEKPGSNIVAKHPHFGLPRDVKTILGFMLDNRPISVMEYDKLIKYLNTKRESTLKDEYGTNIPAHLLLPPVGPTQEPMLRGKQEEIQRAVIEICNKNSNILMSKAAKGPPPNPGLQDALQSLLTNRPSQRGSSVEEGRK